MTSKELARSAHHVVTHDYEHARVTAADGRQAGVGEFYGDPAVALIDVNEQWCVVAGEGLVLCGLGQAFGQCAAYFRAPGATVWVTDLRQTGPFALQWQGEDGTWSTLVFAPADVSAYAPGR
ncbi:hypothetical protein [Janthinobacterium sp. 1_2014MBL_MicDiv]|uniref:hypothetical protein n=1 Tax=Janthinobacterium sp. 1_2014MBL_MicDiv TaxID=1644131 RepID=UPI0008F4FD4A|nr:hypothetical protein [Janthinobacterium sp. 1_2014MBL_MicDiv]APA69561.1 hypothetical protein YQ44_19230 [Janthinobacterium sp. 1_2014MBL_MicDiv]